MEERFKKPSKEELRDLAITCEGDDAPPQLIASLMAFGTMIIRRLHENGNINDETKEERRVINNFLKNKRAKDN